MFSSPELNYERELARTSPPRFAGRIFVDMRMSTPCVVIDQDSRGSPLEDSSRSPPRQSGTGAGVGRKMQPMMLSARGRQAVACHVAHARA